jgi:hypothetical protein
MLGCFNMLVDVGDPLFYYFWVMTLKLKNAAASYD